MLNQSILARKLWARELLLAYVDNVYMVALSTQATHATLYVCEKLCHRILYQT